MFKNTLNKYLATLYPDWVERTMDVINNSRRLFWEEIHTDMHAEDYKSLLYGKPFKNYAFTIDSHEIIKSFNHDNDKVQREYFMVYPKELVFSPRYGWAMTRKGQIIIDSLPYTYYALLPGLHDYLRAIYPPSNARTFNRIASFRDIGDKNYYHLYNDHLVKFAMFKKYIHDDVPILVSHILYSKPFFQEAIARSGLKDRTWVVQDKDYVVSKESYFCGTMPITKEYFDYVLAILRPPKPNPNINRKIFINRGKASGRCIANISEIQAVVDEFDFESINLDECNLAQQMQIFSEARIVVGIHGAGLTNIIFRAGEELSVIEMFPPNNIPAMFFWICCRYGFDYDALVGYQKFVKRADRQQYARIDFYIDPETLRKKIAARLSCCAKTG